MWATPLGTLRLAFLGPVFLAGFAMALGLQSRKGFGRKAGREGTDAGPKKVYFFLPATVLRAPRRVRALVRVR